MELILSFKLPILKLGFTVPVVSSDTICNSGSTTLTASGTGCIKVV